MYRIKTDIRQYKCETKEKVEKLIRNWVIRPNDLIFTTDKTWEPIGEHPSFVSLFGMLEEQERHEPDTVITARPTKEKKNVKPMPVPEPPPELETEGSDEVTQLRERPTRDEAEDAEEAVADGAPEDARETDVIDQAEIAASMSEAPLAPPEAPEGVEMPAAPDEVTVMTERTLDLLTVTDEDEAAERAKREAEDDETTGVRERDEVEGKKENASDPDATVVTERKSVIVDEPSDATIVRERESVSQDDDEDGVEATVIQDRSAILGDDEEEDDADKTIVRERELDEDDETTGVRERDEVEGESRDDESANEVNSASVKDATLAASKPRLGRHNLPEEFFATNEIMGPFDRDAPVIDDLGELSDAASKPEADDEKKDDDSVDEVWDTMGDDLRVTEELSDVATDDGDDEVTAVVAERDVEGSKDEDDEEVEPAEEEGETSESHDEDTIDQDVDGDTEETDELEPEDVHGDDDYDDYDDYEDEWDDYDDELEAGEAAADLFGIPTDHVEDPYAVPLPFTIAPNDSDTELGIERDSSSRAAKDRAFPYPSAKSKGRVYTKTFDLTPPPPRDRTAMFVASFVVGVLMLIVLLVVAT